jgi:hypothetical protein
MEKEGLERFYFYSEWNVPLVPLKEIAAKISVAFQISLKVNLFFLWSQCLSVVGPVLVCFMSSLPSELSFQFRFSLSHGDRDVIHVWSSNSTMPMRPLRNRQKKSSFLMSFGCVDGDTVSIKPVSDVHSEGPHSSKLLS